MERFFQRQAEFGYDAKDPRTIRPGGMDSYTWWQLHALKQNVRGVKTGPGSGLSPRAAPPSRMGSSSPRYRHTGYSPRSFELGTATMYPPFVDPLPKPVREPTPEVVEEAPAEEVVVDVGPTRKHGELPPGVTPNDLRRMATSLKEKLIDKCGSLQKAFRAIDKDGSGTIEVAELKNYLEVLNLHHGLRDDVLTALFETIDADASGAFDFKEFSRVMSAADVMNMAKIADRVDGYAEEAKKIAAQERAQKEYAAKQAGMTVEEFDAYWATVPVNAFSQMTSAEMAAKASKGTRTGLQARGR